MKDLKALKVAQLEAEKMRDDAVYNAQRIEENMESKIQSAWKQGSDERGRNYYYNYVTGESRWSPPENWKVEISDQWIRNKDDRHNVYYYNTKTGESRWLPPCCQCGEESKRWCVNCSQPYCETDYDHVHFGEGTNEYNNEVSNHMKSHIWSSTECVKEPLKPGEVHCIECKYKVGILMCMECWDAYCDDCYKYVHHIGTLQTHKTLPYKRAKRGWVCIKGRISGEHDYYVHGTTGETTHEKPFELMNDHEKILYQNFKLHRDAAEQQVKLVEKLQYDLEAAKYERDKVLYDSLLNIDKNGKVVSKNAILTTLGIQSQPNAIIKANEVVRRVSVGSVGISGMISGLSKEYRDKLLKPSTRERNKSVTNYINQLLNDEKQEKN